LLCELEGENGPQRLTAGVAQVEPMVDTATDDRAIGELCPVSRSIHTHITRPNMKNAIRIAAKRLDVLAPVHAVSHALSQRKHREKYWFGLPVFIYSNPYGARFQRQSAIR
jgi:hypothetical protein